MRRALRSVCRASTLDRSIDRVVLVLVSIEEIFSFGVDISIDRGDVSGRIDRNLF